MSTELVTIRDNEKAVTTSRIIANVFCKQHKNVLQDIKNLECSDEFRRLNFQPSSYTSLQGKELPMYIITRDGFTRLAMGFTGEKAADFKEEYLRQFNAMEALLLSDDYIIYRASKIQDKKIKMLEGVVAQKDEIIALQAGELKESAPKVAYYNEVLQAENAITTTIIAKELGMSAIRLNQILFELGLQYRQSGQWVLYAKHDGKGYTKTNTFKYVNNVGEVCASVHTEWTQTGRELIHKLITHYRNAQKQALSQASN